MARFLLAARRDPLTEFAARAARHGDVASSRLPGRTFVLVHRADHVEHVLLKAQDRYPKGPEIDLLAVGFGRGLVTNTGPTWRRQRTLVQPLFAKRHVDAFVPEMAAAGDDLLAGWRDGDEVDVTKAMMGVTLDVVGRALFGYDLDARARTVVDRAMTVATTELLAAGVDPLMNVAGELPGVGYDRAFRVLRPRRLRRLRAAMAGLDTVVHEIVGRRRAAGDAGDDLLGRLLQAGMTDREVRDEVVGFLLAGHETTANALAWMWIELARHPAALARLQEETGDDAWARACFLEAMRLHPPVWNVVRHAVADDEIGGFRVREGATVMCFVWLTHRDPDVWDEPERFDPARFLDGIPRRGFVPFGGGRRICVGNTFALAEGALLAAMIARRFELRLAPGADVGHEVGLSLRPRAGLRMRLVERTEAAARA